ncbi:putative addiction module component [Fuerstiella marisgermanici]|uniref:Putative addiction module component n=2 Tax=Fuerstiella marisgermanici TaxID=1891926 RepID=A0A1P8WKJ9_9PLAN|nr:putative addiction module component [Fuerstiella marisgermanici]
MKINVPSCSYAAGATHSGTTFESFRVFVYRTKFGAQQTSNREPKALAASATNGTNLFATRLAMQKRYTEGMTTLTEILNAAQSLPSGERAQLIAALWDDVSPTDWVPPDSHWVAEADRRSNAYDSGEMTGAVWADVRQRARRKAGLDG